MNHPWGLSGPEFLWLYGGGLVVAVGWAVVVRMRARRPRLSEPPPELDLDQLAFLAGGSRRLVELSVARLLTAGKLRTSRKGTLTTTSLARFDGSGLDDAVLRKLGQRSLRADRLVREVRATKQIERVADSLTSRQLLLTPTAARRAKGRAVRGLYLLLAIGLARLVNGLAEDLPVGYLAIELAVTLVVVVVLHNRSVRPRTVHGSRALAAARQTVDDELGPVVFGGLAAYPDEVVGEALVRVVGTRSGSSSSWAYGGAAAAGGAYATCSAGYGSSAGGWSSGDSGGGGSSCGGGGGCGGGSS